MWYFVVRYADFAKDVRRRKYVVAAPDGGSRPTGNVLVMTSQRSVY